MRSTRVSQVTIRLGDSPTHIRRTVSDPLSEAVPCQLSTSSLLGRRLGEVVLVVRAALATRIMHGEHFDSGWSVVSPTGPARLVKRADEPDGGGGTWLRAATLHTPSPMRPGATGGAKEAVRCGYGYTGARHAAPTAVDAATDSTSRCARTAPR